MDELPGFRGVADAQYRRRDLLAEAAKHRLAAEARQRDIVGPAPSAILTHRNARVRTFIQTAVTAFGVVTRTRRGNRPVEAS